MTVYGLYILDSIIFMIQDPFNSYNSLTHSFNKIHKHDFVFQHFNIIDYSYLNNYAENTVLKKSPRNNKKRTKFLYFYRKPQTVSDNFCSVLVKRV